MTEKKEIWKLIELYYEHKLDLLKRDMRGNWATEREIELADIEKVEEDELEKNLNKLSELKPFIKWLVENDKIDREQFYDKARKIITDFDLRWEYEWACNEIIMLLSIQDTPIDDLILYLK